MNFLEKDLEDIIFKAPTAELKKRGLTLHHNRKRQLKVGNYGVLDIVSIGRKVSPFGTRYLSIQVLELKQDKIDSKAFFQAVRYVKGIKSWLLQNKELDHDLLSFEIILIGRYIEKESSLVYLTDLFNNDDFNTSDVGVYFYTYEYDFDGIKFNIECNYSLIQEGFGNG